MSEMNFMDVFLEHDNLQLIFDKDDMKNRKIEKQDEEHLNWVNDIGDDFDFLNTFLKTNDCVQIFDQLLNTTNDIPIETGHECSSDSGLSCEQAFSPTRTDGTEDLQSIDTLHADDTHSTNGTLLMQDYQLDDSEMKLEFSDDSDVQFDAVEYVKEEVVECEEIPLSNLSSIDSDSNSVNEIYVITDENDLSDGTEIQSERSSKTASPILLSYPTLQTIKVVNPTSKTRVIKRFKSFNDSQLEGLRAKRKYSEDLISEEGGSDDSDFVYPRLQLTPEEQKLASKEGIKLPTHYPLTKIEERELKRIRRKIRNKISAQDSRRRKKEYVDGLEERVKRCTEENAHLMKRIKTLQNQNVSLIAQVRKLQASLARSSGQTAQPSTCLLVLIMSLALVLAPTLRNSPLNSEANEDEGISLTEDGSTTSLNTGHSRNLLFSHKAHEGQCNLDEEAKTLTEQLEKMQLPNSNLLTGLLETLKLKMGKENSLLKDHDYFRPRKRPNSESDGSWPPRKISPSKMTFNAETILNSLIIENTNKSETMNSKEPVIIDLLSD